MMKATAFEFRFRLLIVFVLIVLGVWSFGFQSPTVWMLLAGWLAHQHWLGIQQASLLVGYAAALLALAGALLRTWGTAYVGARIVTARGIHADQLITGGPFRYTRNPLYVGTELNLIALAVLMQLAGAIFVVIAGAIFFYRLALAEEALLGSAPGYREYAARVPRCLPSLRPRVLPPVQAAMQPGWVQAFFSEVYYWGAAASFAAFVPQYNAGRILQGVGISFGVSLIVKALWPAQRAAE